MEENESRNLLEKKKVRKRSVHGAYSAFQKNTAIWWRNTRIPKSSFWVARERPHMIRIPNPIEKGHI